ncbi:MAG: Xaa-Pro aminopeptidase [Candidatus Calescibacterium sp.]|nr:Xaa-Pro aminopeptidase [Candidatus Calescibacterium sp.]MCX7734330.1 Xaa-Pro aminopeptidase [bacterium]MDW8087601.1 Xaa-Pro aminopeptidase [Candidatus Calescibacterium sp.]
MLVFPIEIIKKRQKTLFEKLPPNSVAIIPSESIKIRNNDVEYRFRPSSRLLYITGIKDPNTIAVISKKKLSDGEETKIIIFRKKNKFEEAIWIGFSTPDEELKQVCDEIENIENFDTKISKIIQNTEYLFYPIGEDGNIQNKILKSYYELKRKARAGTLPPKLISDIDTILGELRAKKDQYEIENIRKAVKITKKVLNEIALKPGMMEYEVESQIIRTYRMYGGEEAFPTIVASGKNSTILHYTQNSSVLKIPCVIDTGVEINFYASDITRTFIPEDFPDEPKEKVKIAQDIKSQVEIIQKKVIEKARKGVSFEELNLIAQREISYCLIDIGILKGSIDEILEKKLFKPFFPHRIGHHLGLDVHDVCPYYEDQNRAKKLEAGNIITIEPGIYFPYLETVYVKDGQIYEKPDAEGQYYKTEIPEIFRGIGVRIEDDVIITEDGNEVL